MLTIQAFPDVTILSRQLMPTIPTGYLPMRTRVFNIIIVMMVIAATVALVRSMLTIQAFPDVTIVSHQLMPTIPTAYLMDYFPGCTYLPSKNPGTIEKKIS